MVIVPSFVMRFELLEIMNGEQALYQKLVKQEHLQSLWPIVGVKSSQFFNKLIHILAATVFT